MLTANTTTAAATTTTTTTTSPLVGSQYAYKPPTYNTYTPIYHTYTPPSYTEPKYSATPSVYSNSSNIFDPPVDSSSSTAPSATTQRPYVSAIRKRRTLFSDGFDPSSGSETEGFYSDNGMYSNNHNSSFNSYKSSRDDEASVPRSSTTGSIYSTANGTANARTRPLSIVSEEANSLKYNLNPVSNTTTTNTTTINSASATIPIKVEHQQQEAAVKTTESKVASYRSLPRPLIKKSNSINSNKYESTPLNTLTNSISNSNLATNAATTTTTTNNNNNTHTHTNTTTSTVNPSTAKIRSTPFNRSTAISSSNETATTVPSAGLVQPKRLGVNNNSEPKNNILASSNIKCQNEIAIVTSMMPKNRDASHTGATGTGGGTTSALSSMSRIRSLDSKNREKLKTNHLVTKKPPSQAWVNVHFIYIAFFENQAKYEIFKRKFTSPANLTFFSFFFMVISAFCTITAKNL